MIKSEYLSKILIATPDKETEDDLLKVFTNYDFYITCYDQINQTLLGILEEDFDIAIIDDDLSKVGGYSIIPLMRKLRPKIPIIRLYSCSDSDNLEKFNISLTIKKPLNNFKISEITKNISFILNGCEINN